MYAREYVVAIVEKLYHAFARVTWVESAKKRADKLSTTTGKTILPNFTTRTEAQEEADRLNIINQSVISAKEGVVEAVSKLVGSDITDAILRTADGSD